MMIKINFSFTVLATVLVTIMLFFLNQSSVNSQVIKSQETIITADIFDIKRKTQIIDFLGNVVVKKGEDRLFSDKMTVFYDEKGKNDKNIKKIEAYDNVKISSKDYIVSGEKGEYDPVENVFIVEKNVVVNKGNSVGYGEKFVYNLTTRKGNFVGNFKDNVDNKSVKDKRVILIIDDKDKK